MQDERTHCKVLLTNYTQDKKNVINFSLLQSDGNPIVKWYFAPGDKQDELMPQIVLNIIDYASYNKDVNKD